MPGFFERLDSLAGTDTAPSSVRWLQRVAFVFLVLMVLSAPHSIAATQIAWLTGMLAWMISVVLSRRSGGVHAQAGPPRTLNVALWLFFAWSALTSLTSYAPDISINKLRGVAVFLIFYFVFYNVRNRKAAHMLAIALIVSCMVNVIWTPVQRLIGRGVEIHGLAPEGPLAKAFLWEGDALLEANGKKVRDPEDVRLAVEANEITKIKFYRPDFEFVVDVKRADLLAGTDATSRLGFSTWKKSRNWRSTGFYGHYTTYAEVLQLVLSLLLGLFVAGLWERWGKGGRETRNRKQETGDERREIGDSNAFPRFPSLLLFICLAAMSLALLLTVTRASQLAFLISAAVMVLVGLGRKWLLAAGLIGLPIIIIGLLFLQQSRQVGFFDTKDESIRWRQTVWREGFDLWTSSPRNFMLGVGMDSIKRFAPEWHMFDDGRLNQGHFHSTPLNLVVERGLPALLIWLIALGVYARSLWRSFATAADWLTRGIFLGCLGGPIGFFSSGLVHYNLGDQEVAMMFFLLMGLGMSLSRLSGLDRVKALDTKHTRTRS
ncbi:MAG TPA: O-antigen ligase family protein [Pyrinomonadaceae bacterium]|nr:O-antigen ligase family protein [Pyrinomonadaceae bacterium]